MIILISIHIKLTVITGTRHYININKKLYTVNGKKMSKCNIKREGFHPKIGKSESKSGLLFMNGFHF